ncbi:Hypothetical predicted protein [Octopus vulgaris]|uniref:PiggyBac transposable element-derived protein domain-containing protein n=1 Tax=Octopus vulgaris TaxID=6645 RepID=A0AA36AT40_OCTVU|nr:Hypothetical predicted protein [Octopus vulgaris]
MPKRENLSEDQIPKRLLELNEEWEEDSIGCSEDDGERKYEIKIWVICDSKPYYAWKRQIYTGKDPVKGGETNQGSRVVEDLVKELENTGCNITCDNFLYKSRIDLKVA